MKTIAVSIDEPTLESLDRLMRSSAGPASRGEKGRGGRNRSRIVRLALREFLKRQESIRREERERSVFAAHRRLIARQAKALVGEQAAP